MGDVWDFSFHTNQRPCRLPQAWRRPCLLPLEASKRLLQLKYSTQSPPHCALPEGCSQGQTGQLITGISEVNGGVRLFLVTLCFTRDTLLIFVQSYPAPIASSHRMFWTYPPLWPWRLQLRTEAVPRSVQCTGPRDVLL